MAGSDERAAWLDYTAEKMQTILTTKILGAWNLHALTRLQPLTHFVLFSSVASFFGSNHQLPYVNFE